MSFCLPVNNITEVPSNEFLFVVVICYSFIHPETINLRHHWTACLTYMFLVAFASQCMCASSKGQTKEQIRLIVTFITISWGTLYKPVSESRQNQNIKWNTKKRKGALTVMPFKLKIPWDMMAFWKSENMFILLSRIYKILASFSNNVNFTQNVSISYLIGLK